MKRPNINILIFNKIFQIELIAKDTINKERKMLNAIISIKQLLNKIDFSAEIVPINDFDQLKELLIDLKNEPLNEVELKLIQRIIKI